ncbi:MAG: LamG-like jellyroll fold domain-containing protein, partial [Candidatus Zixiibacteriota bacterium]
QDDASLEIKKTFYEPDAYDKLLIHSDSTDGATSFGDSTIGKTITVAGNTHHEKDQAKIGQTSMYFDGTGDYLSLADSDDWNFGSGDFTVDTWVYATSWDNYDGIVAKWHSVTDASRDWAIIAASGVINFAWHTGSGTGGIAGVSALSTNAWHHIAAVRNGSDMKLYVDGSEYATGSITTIRDSAVVLDIGSYSDPNYYFNGYIDEVRVSKGVARWTANFDPLDPADESEIDTNGGYLTVGRSGSNRKPEIIEYSAYNASTNTFTLSQRGDSGTTATDWPSDTPIEVGGTATLSAAPAEGEKVLVNYNYQGDELDRDRGQIKSKSGQNNFLDYTASATTGWALSGDTANKSGRQTITTQVVGQNAFGYFYGAELGYIFSGDTTNGGVAMIVVDEGTGNERRIRSDQNNSATNQFYDHLFSGLTPGYHTFRIISGVDETNSGSNKYGTFDGFVSGTKSDLSAPTTGLSGSEPTSGDTVNDTFYYPAWKDQDDVINTRDSNTKLLLHADGANNATVSYDSALPQKYLTHNGDAKISTAQSKFGGSSYYFDGTGDYLSLADGDDWNFGTGNFTIDTWVYFDGFISAQDFASQYTDNNNYLSFSYQTNSSVGLRLSVWSGGSNVVSLNQGN